MKHSLAKNLVASVDVEDIIQPLNKKERSRSVTDLSVQRQRLQPQLLLGASLIFIKLIAARVSPAISSRL